ncbi:hypothetical protein H257_07087 [Aphanomyces astaci]|uniref:Uncharacterized protein n=1 Tax=Aphanomyces astaci TaxID=112090 RepID=W4GJJ6_APHAT|nr:hypothetical protein H257_07087 [Aphanomyces astaci]ETV79872.1 hypothetical protein H257_07087 [Aphanomyces astaci]RQM22856.1 hypothetical protein B5M09_005024 [Aphanomyces astaci]|eukprot:XP_009830808.1 hypothetical protein H257_07087 [Aphanomyces astaci]
MSILPRSVLDSSFDHLLSLRTTGRYLFASLAVNMLLQAGFISFKLAETVHAIERNDVAFASLVTSYVLWILISTAGGVFGLYSAHKYHTKSASYCLYAWVALVVFQIVEAFVAVFVLVPGVQNTVNIKQSLLFNTASLLVIEVVFIGFIYAYIELLDLCETDKNHLLGSHGEEGTHLVDEALVSPVVDNHVTAYGTESTSFTF